MTLATCWGFRVDGGAHPPKKRTWGDLRATWVAHDIRDELVDFVRRWSEASEIAYGLMSGGWISPMLTRVIQEEYGVEYHPAHVRKRLQELGFSVQRPRRQLAKGEPVVQNLGQRRTQNRPVPQRKPWCGPATSSTAAVRQGRKPLRCNRTRTSLSPSHSRIARGWPFLRTRTRTNQLPSLKRRTLLHLDLPGAWNPGAEEADRC